MGKTGLQCWLQPYIQNRICCLILGCSGPYSFPKTPLTSQWRILCPRLFHLLPPGQRQLADIGSMEWGLSICWGFHLASCLSAVHFLWMWSPFYFLERFTHSFRNCFIHWPFITFNKSAIIFIVMYIVCAFLLNLWSIGEDYVEFWYLNKAFWDTCFDINIFRKY